MLVINVDQENGYRYYETSEYWKKICSPLPCFAEMWWPGYLTKVVRAKIGSHDVIIQLWKGWCQRFMGPAGNFPGGIGAEVGIYRKVNDDETSVTHPHLFRKAAKHIDKGLHHARDRLDHASHRAAAQPHRHLAHEVNPTAGHGAVPTVPHLPRYDRPHGNPDGEVWYPFPELGTQLWFKLVNPVTGTEFFQTKRERTYWLTRWMDPQCYRREYQRDYATPPFAENYQLHYTIDGISYAPW